MHTHGLGGGDGVGGGAGVTFQILYNGVIQEQLNKKSANGQAVVTILCKNLVYVAIVFSSDEEAHDVFMQLWQQSCPGQHNSPGATADENSLSAVLFLCAMGPFVLFRVAGIPGAQIRKE